MPIDRLGQVLLLQLTTFPGSSGGDSSQSCLEKATLTTKFLQTANDRQLEISYVEDPSGMWSSFQIAEEGSLDSSRIRDRSLFMAEGGGG